MRRLLSNCRKEIRNINFVSTKFIKEHAIGLSGFVWEKPVAKEMFEEIFNHFHNGELFTTRISSRN